MPDSRKNKHAAALPEPETDSVDRTDIFLPGIVGITKLFPQIADMDIDRVVLTVVAVLPYQFIEAFPGIDLIRSLQEQEQEGILMDGEENLGAADCHFTRFRIELYILIRQKIRLLWSRAAAPEGSMNPRGD